MTTAGTSNRHEERRHGMREEVLDELDVMSGHRHQIAGAPANEPGRCEPVELLVERDAHLGEHAERHVMREPRFQPVQHPRQRRDDRENHPGTAVYGSPCFTAATASALANSDPDQGRDPAPPRTPGRPRTSPSTGRRGAGACGTHRPSPVPRARRMASVGSWCAHRVVHMHVLRWDVPMRRPRRNGRRERCIGPFALLGLGAHQPEVGRRPRACSDAWPPVSTIDPWSSTRMRSAPDHARQPMREDEGGAALHQPVERLLDDPPRSPRPPRTAPRRGSGSAHRGATHGRMAMRCRCPPESLMPRSPTTVA